MFIKFLQQYFTRPVNNFQSGIVKFWLGLSLASALLYAYLGGILPAFSSEYVVQDDARQHVFWMLRFSDPKLFPNDLIADYFQSVAPLGYLKLYQWAANLGIDPFFFNKILPIFLGVIATGYCFWLLMEFFPVPAAGFLAASFLNQVLWLDDDIASGTPRAFVYPLFLAFLYYFVRKSKLPCLAAIALLGLFYPAYALIAAGVLVLQLVHWKNGGFKLTPFRQDYWLCGLGLAVAFVVLLPFAFSVSEFEPVISVEKAKSLPEFHPGGRAVFFRNNPLIYWLGGRSGLLPYNLIFIPVGFFAGLALPFLLRKPDKFPLIKAINSQTTVLIRLLAVSLFLFFVAHLFLFELHLPSRYTHYNLLMILPLMGAITITIFLDRLLGNTQGTNAKFPRIKAYTVVAFLGLVLMGYPKIVQEYPQSFYIQGQYPELYEFLQQQPRDSLIASLSQEADNLPSFARRPVLASREVGIPYHWGYYQRYRQRTLDLIAAQYSPKPNEVQTFIDQYEIDFWLLERNTFTLQHVQNHRWLGQFDSIAPEIEQKLANGVQPALKAVWHNCAVYENARFRLLESECIEQQLSTSANQN